MGTVTEAVTRLAPLNLLVDRSRDGTLPDTVRDLQPHGVFRTTENFRTLSRRMLAEVDMLVCCGHGTKPYSRAERAAVREFVEAGGTLVLSSSAGQFEFHSERPVERMAVHGLAAKFGFGFENTADLPRDHRHNGIRQHSRRSLELTAAGRKIGLTRSEHFLWHPGSIRTPPCSTVLLRVRRTGDAVIAHRKVGRGRVAVYGDNALFENPWTGFPLSLHLAHHAPQARRSGSDRPPAVLDVPREELAGDHVTVRFTPFTRRRAPRLLELAGQTLAEMQRHFRFPAFLKHLRMEIAPGCHLRAGGGEKGEVECVVGSDLSDARFVARLTRFIGARLLFAWWGRRAEWPFTLAATTALSIKVLRSLGFADAAEQEAAILRDGPAVDMSTYYSQEVYPPRAVRRFFLELTDDLGDDVLLRFSRAIPKKKPFEGLPGDPLTALDRFAFYLARAYGEQAYDAIEARGHTLHRLPLAKPGSDEFRKGSALAMLALLADPEERTSVRLDAARHMLGRLVEDEQASIKAARGKNFISALPAALALATRRGPGALGFLRKLSESTDSGVAAIASLVAVSELGERTLADRLVALAGDTDTAFQLAVGQALASIGDRRAERFSFGSLPGCTFRMWVNGTRLIYAAVDGQEVAIVLVGPTWWTRGHGAATSTAYVFWVHTRTAFRRLGISRAGFARMLGTRWCRTCVSTQLHAMSDYFAHALYRDFDLIDSHLYVEFDKPVENPAGRAPRGIRIRAGRREDAAPVAKLSDRVHAPREHPPLEVPDFPGRGVTRLAEEQGKLVGAVWFTGSKLAAFAVDDGIEKADRREAIGIALLRSAERELHRRKVKSLRAFSWMRYDDAFHIRCLYRAGFAGKRDHLREQTRIRDLGQFLAEMERTLTARVTDLKKAPPPATITIRGGRLKAAFAIGPDGVEVLSKLPAGPDLTVEGTEESIERMVLPISSPFEEYNQTAIRIRPPLTGEVRMLLESLFPRTCV